MDIVMPQLGETVSEGTVSAWYRKPGDHIKADESLFEVETEKVSMEIPSPVTGLLQEILVEAGTTVKVGTRLAIVDTVAAAQSGPVVAAARLSPAPIAADSAAPA